MVRLNAITPDEISVEIGEKRREIAIEIVTKVMYAIDNSLDSISMDIECPLPIDIIAEESEYQKALITNTETLLEYEEYEILSKVSNYVNE